MAKQSGFEFIPFVFHHNSRIHSETVSVICRQIEAKLMIFDGRVSKSSGDTKTDIFDNMTNTDILYY